MKIQRKDKKMKGKVPFQFERRFWEINPTQKVHCDHKSGKKGYDKKDKSWKKGE